MEPVARANQKSTNGMAESGKLHKREKHSRSNPGTSRRRNISAEEKEMMNQLRQQGLTAQEVAKKLGRSRSAVYRHLHQGGKLSRWTDDEMQILVDGYAAGWKPAKIAKKTGRSPVAVRVRMWRHRQDIRNDPKKRRALNAITLAFKAVRKADIFREMEG